MLLLGLGQLLILSVGAGWPKLIEIKESVVCVSGFEFGPNFPEKAEAQEDDVNEEESEGPFHDRVIELDECEIQNSTEGELHRE